MTAQGSFAVSESGAATYTVPIAIPPGIAGMEPKLSLAYNSQGGNGLLGMGWSLQGLSAITRCPQTMAQDNRRGGVNYDADDRFCLDGQRLVLVSASGAYGAGNSEYRIERDGFAQIKASTATINYDRCPFYTSPGCGTSYGVMPQNFTVKTKAGLTMEYGVSADSAIKAQGKATVVTWALNKVTDTKGNYYTVTYVQDTGASGTGEWRPSRLDYTGNGAAAPQNSIVFIFEARPDQVGQYRGGSLFKTTQRMLKAQTYIGTTLVKEYKITYGLGPDSQRSRVVKVDECAGTACKSSIAFGYPQVTSRWKVDANFAPPAWLWARGYGRDGRQLIDINGDGLPDLVYNLWVGDGQERKGAWINTGSGWQVANQFSPPTPIWFRGGNPAYQHDGHRFIDLNADGLPDIAYKTWITNYAEQGAWLNNGSGWASNTQLIYPIDVWARGGNPPYASDGKELLDLNGDGRPDVAYNLWVGDGIERKNAWLNTGTGWEVVPGLIPPGFIWARGYDTDGRQFIDLNGDGLPDFAYNTWITSAGYSEAAAWVNTGSSWVSATRFNPPTNLWVRDYKSDGAQVVDLNGDGLPDIAYNLWVGDGFERKNAWLNTGNGWVNAPQYAPPYPLWSRGGYGSEGIKFIDLNGDGLLDLAYNVWVGDGYTRCYAWLNTGNGWQANNAYCPPAPVWYRGGSPAYEHDGYEWVDINGDGLLDLVWNTWVGDGIERKNAWVAERNRDLISTITVAGATVSIAQNPLAGSTIYVRDSGSMAAVYPQVDLQNSLYVVSKVDRSHGLGGSGSAAVASTSYRYGGLKASYDGRGMLGFRWVEAKDESTGVRARTEYRQDFPYTGLVDKGCRTTASVATAADCTAIMAAAGKLGHSANSYGYIDALGSGTYNIGSGTTATLACPLTAPTVTAGKRYFPYSCQGVEQGWDLNGAVLPTVTTKSEYDAWGNAAKISVHGVHPTDTTDRQCKVTENTYLGADTSNWILGRLSRAKVTAKTGTDANVCP